ncbi:MAG: hypothetical protein ACSHWQ_07950 [Spongiibacteraceae bacterium]
MKLSRHAYIALACCLLQACEKQSNTDPVVDQAESIQAKPAGKSEHSAPAAAHSTSPAVPPSLNLSLPDDYKTDDSPLSAAEDDDKNVFNANAVSEERKLKFKPKVHIKEGTTFDSAVGGQGDAIEGAEFGVEYKIP